MDLLIEVIVWIFKALAGEGSSKGTPGKPGSNTLSAKRGPYNYGDKQNSGGAKPRTLEEILEEVKRQQGKGGAPRPSGATPSAAPPTRAKAPSLSRPLSEVQPPNAVSPAPTARSTQGGAIQSRIENRTLKPSLDEKETVKPGFERKFERIDEREDQRALGIGHTKMVAEVNTVTTMNEVQSVDKMGSSLSDKKVNTFADYFRAMRTAPPKARAEMARRAFVYAEVFGPPKCKRPHTRR